MNKGRSRRFVAPRIEPLESRLPMAGDVAVFVGGGNLRIVGDAFDNSISITQTAPGAFTIAGNAGEMFRLNGGVAASDPVNVTGISAGLFVALGKGNDSVSITGLSSADVLAKRVSVLVGAGSDAVSITNARITGPLTVEAGAGDRASDADVVAVASLAVTGPLVVNTGHGDDVVSVDDLSGRQLAVNTGSGNDRLTVAATGRVALELLAVALGDGNDDVTVGSGTLSLRSKKNAFVAGRGTDTFTGIGNIAADSQANVLSPSRAGFESVS